jgi:hypothetical protein
MAEVLELRQYTLRPGRRDELVELFDRELAGPQVLGQFRDLDDEDRFVLLSGFADLETRARALPVFHEDRATMVEATDVLLLRPVTELELKGRGPTTLVTVTICHLPPGGEEAFLDYFKSDVAPMLTATGAAPLAVLRTLRAENPFHEDANVVAWVTSYPGRQELLEHVRMLGREGRWTHDTLPALTKQLSRPPEQLQLSPTERSLLR